MKIFHALLSILVFNTFLLAQYRDDPDTLSTEDEVLIIQPVVHGSLALSWKDQMIYVDPYGGGDRYEGLANPTIILITDIHGDHLNQKTLDALNTQNAIFITPPAVEEKLPQNLKAKCSAIENGQTVMTGEIEILAIPMYNLPESNDSRHPKGRGNGYVLKIGGKKIYISGDTEDTPEMRNLRDIDIAFICMNLPYTMSVDQAADAVIDFQPKIVYPFHYRGTDGLSDVVRFKEKVLDADTSTEIRLKNWYMD